MVKLEQPGPEDGGQVQQEGGSVLAHHRGLSDAKDAPSKADTLSFEFEQPLAELVVDAVGIILGAFNDDDEVSVAGYRGEVSDDIRGVTVRQMHQGSRQDLSPGARHVRDGA